MLKITKGLKKKKKGKKSKHKEEELFKPEELEEYRKKHQQTEEASSSGQNEEWKKFLALTSGVDDILQRTSEDLKHIKETSFFQRVPPPSEVKKREEEQRKLEAEAYALQVAKEEAEKPPTPASLGIVEVSDSESEYEDEDSIFDTAYIDAIAAGDVKLAYIPESPTEAQGDDPFDTSYAERAILGPAVERKGKKLVPIGSAVEVLTGRVQLPTCAVQRPASSRRQILKTKDLLLRSFDDNANSVGATSTQGDSEPEPIKTLLDEDTPLPDEPIDLSVSLHLQAQAFSATTEKTDNKPTTNVDDFKELLEDEDDKEFELLAAESLTKPATNVVVELPLEILPENVALDARWDAEFKDNSPAEDVDPFDTTFAEKILPGKAELKLIENDILNNEIDFDPRANEKLNEILNKVQINVTNSKSQQKSISSSDRISEAELNLIKPKHRDLLGGSTTDLSHLGDQPLKPSDKLNEDYIEYCDPFDTSSVDVTKLSGPTELKFLEKELLSDIKVHPNDEDDFDFDPRAGEIKQRTYSRPDVLNIVSSKSVSFECPSPKKDLLADSIENSKIIKPLTPFYVRKSSIAEQVEESDENSDPFDTSFVSSTAPGKEELRLIENQLFDPDLERKLSISDQDFDPRDNTKVSIAATVQQIQNLTNAPLPKKEDEPKVDLLSSGPNIEAKVLTPSDSQSEPDSYLDPFDTSIAGSILPGKTELKLLESELISNIPDTDFDPRSNSSFKPDLLEGSDDFLVNRPLSPFVDVSVVDESLDFDPFDTTIANNIAPGKAEIKLLESEFIE